MKNASEDLDRMDPWISASLQRDDYVACAQTRSLDTEVTRVPSSVSFRTTLTVNRGNFHSETFLLALLVGEKSHPKDLSTGAHSGRIARTTAPSYFFSLSEA